MQRRSFLQASAAGLATSSIIPATHLFGDDKSATDQHNSPYFKLSLAAYSFTRMLPRNWPTPRDSNPTITLLDFVDFCAEQNLAGCELTSYYFPPDVDESYLSELKRKTFQLGLDISGTAIGNDFCHPAGEKRTFELEMTKRWIDYAAFMGAPAIRIFAGRAKQGQTEEEAVALCVEGINQSVKYAASKGVCLALENHGGITATADQLLTIIKQAEPSPYLGVNFDSGNFRVPNYEEELEKIAPYAINAQIKVSRHEGHTDGSNFPRVIEILSQANYRGYLVLEYEAAEDPFTAIPKYLDLLRHAIG